MDNPNIQRIELEHIYGKISPFELKDRLISLAKESQIEKSAHALLDAGRGNPNWTAAAPREAFFAFGQFAVEETRRYGVMVLWQVCPKKKAFIKDLENT